MTGSYPQLILWLLPPVLGAIIGYVTNAVAIRMLFRPYREWRVLRIRIPFTPGIIPRQRYKLAENIGQMVAKELLTAETLQKQVRSRQFRDGLHGAVSRLTDGFLNTAIGDLKRSESCSGSVGLLPLVEALIRGFLRSAGIKRLIDVVIHAGLRSLTSRQIGELFASDEQKERFISWVVSLLRAPDTGDSLVRKMTEWIGDRSAREIRLNEYVPPEVKEWVVGIADTLYEPFFGFVMEWLESESMRDQIESKARSLLKNILDKLSVLQRFFVVATQYDRTLDEKMPEIVNDMFVSMRDTIDDEKTRRKMLDTIGSNIDRLRASTFGEVNKRYKIASRFAKALESVQRTIAEDPAGDSLKAILRAILVQLEHRSLESFLEHALTVQDAANYLSQLVLKSMQDSEDRISRAAIENVSEIVDKSGQTSVRDLLGITDEGKQKLDESLCAMAGEALEERVADILQTLDLHTVVVSKINGLAVEDVEGLLMRVIHRHLKWINVFGAILGFLIGMMQILTRLL